MSWATLKVSFCTQPEQTSTLRYSPLLRKFASYPRQHELALALREIGRIERTLFIIDWLLDIDMQRRAASTQGTVSCSKNSENRLSNAIKKKPIPAQILTDPVVSAARQDRDGLPAGEPPRSGFVQDRIYDAPDERQAART